MEPAESGGLPGQLGGGIRVTVRRRRRRRRRRGATAALTAEWAALAAASPAASATSGVMGVGDDCDGLVTLLLQDCVDGGVVRLPGAVGPQLVSSGRQGGQRGVSIFS